LKALFCHNIDLSGQRFLEVHEEAGEIEEAAAGLRVDNEIYAGSM
jgi:hypothetical protein